MDRKPEKEVNRRPEGVEVCCCSVTKSYLTLCDPMDCITPGCSVLHHLPESAKIHAIESAMLSNHFIPCVEVGRQQSHEVLESGRVWGGGWEGAPDGSDGRGGGHWGRGEGDRAVSALSIPCPFFRCDHPWSTFLSPTPWLCF